jgi:very-short-patch-repair endonuclease
LKVDTRIVCAVLEAEGLPLPETEYQFAAPHRKWKADFCWPDLKIIVEVEGGVWTGGRHTRGTGYLGDILKYNVASILGYRVLRVIPKEAYRLIPALLRQAIHNQWEEGYARLSKIKRCG